MNHDRGEHAERLVVLDEADSPHVGGEVDDRRRAGCRLGACLGAAQVELPAVDVAKVLVPLRSRLEIDGPDLLEAAPSKLTDEVAADEAARARDKYHPPGVELLHECLPFRSRGAARLSARLSATING